MFAKPLKCFEPPLRILNRRPRKIDVMTLVIIAHIHAVPEHRGALEAKLQTLLAPTRAEAGCQTYDLHVDLDDENHFMFHEAWDSKEHLGAHMASEHFKAFGASTKGMIASFTMHKMKTLG